VSFPTVDALERELARLESRQQLSLRNDIPDYPVEFAVSLGIVPDEWQTEVLASDHPRKILCCGRQTGKSTVGAVLAVHKALTQPGSVVLIVAPGERQAKLLFSKALSLYRQAGHPLPAHSERRTGLELSNGSVIEALPAVERTTRGYSVDLLVVDEAAAVPDMDYHGILPALIATQGEQVLLSTPRGKRGFFHEIWHSSPLGETTVAGRDEGVRDTQDPDDWQRVMVRSDETPRITTEQLEVFRQSMPEAFYRQEFECEWLDTEGSLFSYEDIQEALALGEDVEALQIGGEW
jgi:Terminase large subunit, T4likevirus-type, N-terminal